MYRIIVFLCLFLATDFLNAQELEAVVIADVKPFLRTCMRDTTDMEREQCTNKRLLSAIYKSMVYPDTAVMNETEGTVVAQFIVNTRGEAKEPKIIRDIGDGCGEEVLRVLRGLEGLGQVWRPALIDGTPVNYRFTIPVKFNIPPPPPPPLPYQLIGKDTVYTSYDSYPMLGNTEDGLGQFLSSELKYPKAYADSCFTGSMVAQVLIGQRGQFLINEIYDYSGLGYDFQFELIQLLNSTNGKWTPATFSGRPVNCIYNIRAEFSPKGSSCTQIAEQYAQASEWSREGENLYIENKFEEAIATWTKAIDASPMDGEFRLQRGQALLEQGVVNTTMCEDLEIARRNVPLSGVLEGSYRLLCGQEKTETEQKN